MLLIAIGVAGWLFFYTGAPSPAATPPTSSVTKVPSISSKLMYVGDINWGRYTQRRAEASKLGYDYIMSGIQPSDRANYDAWIGNFECPVTTRDIPYALQVSALQFNCRPEYVQTLAKYFTAGSLANNHVDNNGGQQGLDETRQSLEVGGIQYFGTYNMTSTDHICEIIALPAKTSDGETTSLPVALCGYMYVVNARPTDEQLAVMSQYAKVMPVIAMPHMGVEYRGTAESEKVSAYHRMIDAGADLVIGAHPHVIQNSESYKGRRIAYSVGNFLFDQQSVSPETNLALAIDVNLVVPSGTAARIYNKVGDSCKAFKDTCLAKLQAEIKTRPSIGVSYNFGCFSITSGIPVRGTEAQCVKARTAATVDKLSNLSKQL